MRISDWSSDVCSADLPSLDNLVRLGAAIAARRQQIRLVPLLGGEPEPSVRCVADAIVGFDNALTKNRDRAAPVADVGEVGDKPHFLCFLTNIDVDLAHWELVLDGGRQSGV